MKKNLEVENKTILTDGIRINFVDEGNGTPLLFLHGNLVSHLYFKREILFFKDKYRVVAPDLRGHGKSSFGNSDFNLDVLAEDLHSLIIKLKLKDLILVGHSDGANIVLKYITKYSDVLGAISLSGNISPSGLYKISYLFFEIKRRIANFLGNFNNSYKKKAIILSLITKSHDMEMEDLNKIKVPVLYVAGSHDIVYLKHTKAMVENTPDSKLIITKKTGHHVLKKYKDVYPLIENFAKYLTENKN